VEIAEGYFDLEYKGRTARMPFPRMLPASYYHSAKCASSINIERACTWWGLRATDVMQSVVYGTRHEFMPKDFVMDTRFDVDEAFGTVINRFVAQAVIGHPLTIYGEGKQKRGFLPLRDSMRCLQLLIENPPKKGEYRVVNQYDQIYSIGELAKAVHEVGAEFELKVRIQKLENPRSEASEHHYVIERKKLIDLGYEPKGELKSELMLMFQDILPLKERIRSVEHTINPKIGWKR
jgi:UDP-sulfoquinovose synthase